LLITVV